MVTQAAVKSAKNNTVKNNTVNKIAGKDIDLSNKYFMVLNDEITSNIDEKANDLRKLLTGIDQKLLQKMGDNYFLIRKPKSGCSKLVLKDLYIEKRIELIITGLTRDGLSGDMFYRIKGKEMFSGTPQFTEVQSEKIEDKEGSTKELIKKDYGDDFCHGITFTLSQDFTSGLYTENILLELDKEYAYKVYEDENNYYIELRKPSEVYDKIVVIAAGHGGKDSGALSNNKKNYEKNINLAILLNLKKLLDKEDMKVYYTRTEDETVYLRPRVELADEVDCDYFISIHCNANSAVYANGTEILYYNNEFKGVRSYDLANLFSREIGKAAVLKTGVW